MRLPLACGSDLDRSALVTADSAGPTGNGRQGATLIFFGYAAEAMIGKAVSILAPAAFRRRHTAGWRAAWATGDLDPSRT